MPPLYSDCPALLSGIPHRRLSRLTLAAALAATLAAAAPVAAQTVIPGDVKPTCALTPVEFAGWFSSGNVSPNGGVDPANSIAFSGSSNCAFYKWSEQMFLWVTSPSPAKYGGGAHVFDSQVFYDVSPDQNGHRILVANTPGVIRNFGARISQLGPQSQHVVFDSTGKRFNVAPNIVGPNKLVILNRANQPVEIDRSALDAGGKPILLDRAGRTVEPKLNKGLVQLRDKSNKLVNLRFSRTLLNGRPFFIDPFGNAVPTEQVQADGTVLMAQNGSLVYYALQVNDVYAYFLTGQKDNQIAATTFPTTPAALNSIEAFGLAHGKTFPDGNALAIELKSAWVEATGLDTSKYVTVTATIPTYDKTSPTLWTANGSRQAQLALVGIHVVGSATGHPEMIWATFEHVDNTRNAGYSYTNSANATVNVPQNNAGTWTFSTTPPQPVANQNQQIITNSGANLIAGTPPTPIGPGDTLRVSPWGMPGASTASNTDILSINNSVLTQLASGDIRKNYVMTGSTWTSGGANPAAPGTKQVGTSSLANTTMETTFQPSNCFDCHQDINSMLGEPGKENGLSHIYGLITPLFP